MKRLISVVPAVLLALCLTVTALAAEFTVDPYATVDGMGLSWYQGYRPVIKNNTMTLHLPLRAENCVGAITVSIALEDPHVFLLAGEPKNVTVSPENGVYPVVLHLPLAKNRRNGDYPAIITVCGTDQAGKTLTETIPYIIRIRDGAESHERLTPAVGNVVGDLKVGSDGSLSLTVTNPTTTLSITDGTLTVTDGAGEILMSGSDRVSVPEILPGKRETVTVPMTVKGGASISTHTLTVTFRYQVLGREAEWTGRFTVPVTQAIRLEQGGVQLPTAIAGELANLTLPLMNMGKGALQNVLVKLEMDGVLDPQSVLVGTLAPGETRQAKLTFTPNAVGTHSGTVTVTCEDAYGNADTQTLDVTLTVEAPIPEEETQQDEEEKTLSAGTAVALILCVLLTAGWITHAVILTQKLHKLEEDRL